MACLRRVRALEESGVIRAYTAVLDQRKAGLPVNVWVTVTLDTQKQKGLEAFEQAIGRIPEVMECYLMSGQSDYMLRVVVADLDDFERLHSQHLTRLPNVSRIQSSFRRAHGRARCGAADSLTSTSLGAASSASPRAPSQSPNRSAANAAGSAIVGSPHSSCATNSPVEGPSEKPQW
jgi:DNA-binding Lrp family transcriptional regulator